MPLKPLMGCLAAALVLYAADAAAQCSVGATGVNFGIYDYHGGTASEGQVMIECDAGTPYTVQLSTGGGSYQQREMAGPVNSRLRYNLFTDASYTNVFGDGATTGTAAVAGVGNGTAQSIRVFGRIPARQVLKAGFYTDMIVVTVFF